MELKYIVMTIIKILISVPAVVHIYSKEVDGAALMGGHLNNTSAMNLTSLFSNLDFDNRKELPSSETGKGDGSLSTLEHSEEYAPSDEELEDSEEIPDPSPLVVPGYNLPDNIFNKGKPFYLEKDPLTGQVDFNSKLSSVKLDDDLYDYVDDEPSSDIYDKSNIDRKDGSLSSHKQSDVNQLTPNFHDFLNLPVKYNSEKYVYPLISSSYANTKIQGNVNKYHNHKTYNVKPSTYKPTASPTYYISTKEQHFGNKIQTKGTVHTTTTQRTTTTTATQPTTKVQSTPMTTKPSNLLNSPMNHPSFNEEFNDEYYYEITSKAKPTEIYLTTEDINHVHITTRPSTTITTKRPLSLFEQLFGDYDETITTTDRTKPPSLFSNLPNNKHKNTYDTETKPEVNTFSISSSTQQNPYVHSTPISYSNAHGGPSMISEVSNMGLENSYEYEDEYPLTSDDNIATETKISSTSRVEDNLIKSSNTNHETTTLKITKEETPLTSTKWHETPTKSTEADLKLNQNTNPVTTMKYNVTTTTVPTTKMTKISTESTTVKVTSLPLGANHVTSLSNRQPIIVATQNIREQLNNEKIAPKPFGYNNPVIHNNAPSTSNIHIAHDQDTVSFVMGHQQNVDGGQYVGTALKESPYDSNPFRPFYGQQDQYNKDTSVEYTVQINPQIYKPVQKFPEVAGSAVTIQPLKNSEASLAIGVPVNSVSKKPGQVVDEKLEINNEKIEFPKGSGPKIVFPDDDPGLANLLPLPPNRKGILQTPLPPKSEVLSLNSKPMYHQLPSDLTPPKEQNLVPPPRMDRPRPPWDPRPGHFYSGKPEYARPPRPDIAYKRIDNLPNILPQFRPNIKMHPHGPPHHFDTRLNRQPLLERPSNRPIGFFEQLQPPPPPKNLHNLRKIAPIPPNQSLDQRNPGLNIAEDRIINDPPHKAIAEQYNPYQTPPKVPIANRRVSEDEGEVETLQMIQAKNGEKNNSTTIKEEESSHKGDDDKSLYVVYPVNTSPLKMDVIDTTKKETVVIGTRAELPLPPSKIHQQLNYDQNPIFNTKERNDSPILKPHPKPPTFPIKSDFPYPLEIPDPSVLNPPVPEVPSNSANLDEHNTHFNVEPTYVSSNQWNTVGESTENQKLSTQSNQISATLKTYTEKPIAVAYTPTEPHRKYIYDDRFSMPNYGGSVIPEIRQDEVVHKHPDGTVHAYPYIEIQHRKDELYKQKIVEENPVKPPYQNHRMELDVSSKLEFQAPFQASASIDQSKSQGWLVVRDKKTSTTESSEGTTLPLATTSEFNIENFKPQLEGGFKPIYTISNDTDKLKGIDRAEGRL